MVNSGIKVFSKILIYLIMFTLVCIFFTGHGEFIYEGF